MPAARSAVLGDGVAIGLSGLCLAHCLALPLAPQKPAGEGG